MEKSYVYEVRDAYYNNLVGEFDTEQEAQKCINWLLSSEVYKIYKRVRE